jgi:hypothetical protein
MITINIDKAKLIAHELRRSERDSEFAPLDLKATIPSLASSAETQRQNIRQKYADIQIEIDNSKSIDELKTVVSAFKTI